MDEIAELARMPSLIPGLDEILCGGFLSGGLYMIQGAPGLGKTVLASQILYATSTAARRGIFTTVLGENHGRMMAHLRPMQFFDETAIPGHLTYISGYNALEHEGLSGLSKLIRREVLAQAAKILVLDDVSAVEAKTGDRFEMKRFTHDLQVLASATDCTIFMLTTASVPLSGVENTMVDGLIELRQRSYGPRTERRLIVHKLRGTSYLEGEHAYQISREGIRIFPRLEALLDRPEPASPSTGPRQKFAIEALDGMLGGGLSDATVAMAVGATGAGKTALGLHFLGGSRAGAPGLLFSCYESPARLRQKAARLNIALPAQEDCEILWCPLGEYLLDDLGQRLLAAVQRRGVKRLVIDGFAAFQNAAADPERITRFWAALTNELRARGVTTLVTLELQELAGPEVKIPVAGIPSLCETVILMRYVEVRSRLFRVVSVLKQRDGAVDPTIREFTMTDSGIVLGAPLTGVEAVLSGTGRQAGGDGAAHHPPDHDPDRSG
jgi:circadian clock protein KaiC